MSTSRMSWLNRLTRTPVSMLERNDMGALRAISLVASQTEPIDLGVPYFIALSSTVE